MRAYPLFSPRRVYQANVRWLARLVFLVALAAWAGGVVLVFMGNVDRGLTIGVPAAFVLLAYAWRRVGLWLPDGGGGP